MTESAEALLVAFLRRRDEADFRTLYERITPGMLGLALRLCGGDRETAEDVVQESWFRAVRRLHRFDTGGSVARWLNGFIIRCWAERRRAAIREVPVGNEGIDALTFGGDATVWSEGPLLLRAVHALPDGFRAVLVLHDIEGFTHAEIADRLGIDEGTSKSQLSRARRRVREALSVKREA